MKAVGEGNCHQSSSQVVHLLPALPSLPAGQELHGAQRLPVFLVIQHHHEYPLVRLCQQDPQDQQSRGYPMM